MTYFFTRNVPTEDFFLKSEHGNPYDDRQEVERQEEEVSLSPDETKGGDSDVYRWRDEEIMAGQVSSSTIRQESDKSQDRANFNKQ